MWTARPSSPPVASHSWPALPAVDGFSAAAAQERHSGAEPAASTAMPSPAPCLRARVEWPQFSLLRQLGKGREELFGRVFVQESHDIGVASYHFERIGCYISYANAPKEWRLDDGSAPPAKKFFSETEYHPETRTFIGVVEWEPAFFGQVRWEYEMVFAEDFRSITDGCLRAKSADTEERHRFGGSLVYVAAREVISRNAALGGA